MHNPSRTNQDLLEENYALKQKIEELEQADAERKQKEMALRNSEERLRGIAEAMNQLVWIVGADGRSIYHNPRFVEYTGLKEVATEEIWQIVHPEDRLQLQRRWQEMIRSGSVYQSPCRLHCSASGNYRWFLIQGSVLLDHDGKAAQCLCIATDIDDLKQTEEALRNSEARYRLLHNSMRDAFARVDLDGTIREFNDAYVEMIGYPPEELKEMNFREITPEKWHALEDEIIEKQVIPRGYSDIYEKELRRKDGTVFPVELRTYLLRDYAGKPSAMWAIVRDISERKKAEDILRATFKAAPVGLSLMKGRVFQSVNKAWCDITGYPGSEIIGKTTRKLYENEAEYDRVRQELYPKLLEKGIASVQTKHRRKYGMIRDIVLTAALLQPEALSLETVVAIEDITDRKQKEAALRESEEKFRALVENCGDGILRFDRNHHCLYANRFVIEQTGLPLSPSDFIGKSFYELGFPRDLCDQWQENVERGFVSGQIVRHEFQQPDGKWIDVIQIPEKDDSGQVKALIATSRDITEHKKSEAMLSILFQATPLAICVVDANRVITKVNDYFCFTFGYSPEEMVGRDSRFLYFNEEDYQAAAEAIYSATCLAREFRMRRKDGKEISTLISRSYLNGRDVSEGSIVVVQDISGRKALEEQLRHAQKMEAIGQLAGGVAHDFNNILQAILGYTNIILTSLGPEDRHYGKLMEVEKAGEKAAALTRQLLAFSRRQVLQLGPLDINTVIEDLMKMLRRLIGENIELSIRSDSALGKVNADRSQMDQVIINLCVNARDAMPDGGRLSIETSNIRLDEDDCAKYDLEKPGRYVRLSVTDSGCGMDPETKSKIFEPFFTTKEKWRGTGLGLATVYGIVRQHDGMIEVYSDIGKGSRFDVYLPVIESAEEEATKAGPVPAPGGHETILMAEDDAPLRFLTEEILKLAGYRVLVAVDGEDALRLYRDHGRKVDLLLLDVIMPKKGGRGVYDAICAVHPGIRCLFMSGYSEDAVHTNFILDHGLKLIQKPFKSMDLLRMLRQELDRS